MNREILGCAFLILATIGIVCSGSREPEQRLLASELALTLATIICLVTNFFASIFYLAHRHAQADALALAAAQVGVIFLSVLLVGGPFWFHYLFAVWWPRDKVLTWGVLIWPVYLSCLLLRRSANLGQGSTLGAVLSVFAFLDLPLAYFSVVLRQRRSSSVARLNGALPSLVCICVSLTALAAVAIWLLYQRELNQQEVEAQEASIAR
jgi:heme exporter protein C